MNWLIQLIVAILAKVIPNVLERSRGSVEVGDTPSDIRSDLDDALQLHLDKGDNR